MVTGGKPWSTSDDAGSFHPEVFREAGGYPAHNVEYQGTGMLGLSTKKCPFPDGHLIFKELKY